MRLTLYKCELSGDKILSLYKALNIEVSHHVESMLEARFYALLRVNSERILERFTIFSPIKGGKPKSPETEKQNVAKPRDEDELGSETVTQIRDHPSDIVFSDEFEECVWKYINLHPYEVSGDSLMSSEFWENMINRSPSIQVRSPSVLLHYFKNQLIGKLLKPPLCPKLKLRLYKELRVPMTTNDKKWFLQNERIQIRTSADGFLEDWTTVDRVIEERWDYDIHDLTVDVAPPPEQLSVPGRNISTWAPRDNHPSTSDGQRSSPIAQQSTNHSPVMQLDVHNRPSRSVRSGSRPVSRTMLSRREKSKRVPFSISDQIDGWKYVYHKIKRAVEKNLDPVLPKGITFWEEYVRKIKSPKSASNWSSHFRKQMCPKLHEMNFKRDWILFLLKHIDIEVDERVHKILEKKCNARIKLTSTRHVAVWKFLDIHQEDDVEEDDSVESGEDEDREVEDGSSSCDATLPLGAEEPILQDEEEEEINNHENVADQNAVEDDENMQESVKNMFEDPKHVKITQNNTPSLTSQSPASFCEPVCINSSGNAVISEWNSAEKPFGNNKEQGGSVMTGVLYTVQQDIGHFGNDAVDMMEESVRIVFGKKNREELRRNDDEEVKEIMTATIKNIETIDEDRKEIILSQLDTLIAKAFERLGNVKNCDPYEPYGLRSPNLMLNMGALSPSFAMLPHSPSYLNMAMAAAAKQQLENQVPMHMGPLNPLSQMRMPPYMPQGIVPQNNDRRGYGGGKVKKEDHIKKPLNAFMWFMKENRKALHEEIGNNEKQSAELNKELGKRWHDLPKEEQQKYFEMAKKDRETHKEKYPQWSARENYAVNKKKTKKRRDKSVVLTSENSDQKKCRARFGVNNTEMWCKFCKRKKKCEYATDRSGSDMTDNLDGRGTSGACSSSSGSPSPSGNMGLPSLAQQQLRRTFEMHALINNMPLGSTSTLVSSPQPSSSAERSPQDTNVSDSESDIDEDEEIDPTILHQTDVVLREETMCTL
ncbi:hypothetical protein CAEBREN_07368 [Caenorhabditis brenneri]|uniref:Protein pop-1 n=1 Tax=Caenorhabditis brenneri TaxID=135651 RepID=G0P0V1_CAEBE|nr:hypothetical protein CAEBREN_07368 [Caenorhabditis brenneri]